MVRLISSMGRGHFTFPANTLREYSTIFPAVENPISENGAWNHTTNSWAKIKTTGSPNRAVGTQAGSNGFDDSYAYLSGFRPNVTARATIYKDPTIDIISGEHEVELLFRMADSGSSARGYECNISSIGAYAQIVRWNGTLGDFTVLADAGAITAPVTGDIFKATISGGTITTFIDRGAGFVQLATATDSTWTNGQPGMGMWLQDSSQFDNEQKFGLTSYSVTEN